MYSQWMGFMNSSLNAVSLLYDAILMVVFFPAKIDWYFFVKFDTWVIPVISQHKQ